MVWRKWGRERTKSWGSVLRLILGPGSLVRRYPVALYLSKYIICINKYVSTLFFYHVILHLYSLNFCTLFHIIFYSLFIALLFLYFILYIYPYIYIYFFLFYFPIFFNLKLEIEKILLFPSLKCKNENFK